jgi:hypothetical protein
MEHSTISITTPDISPISINFESPIITSGDTQALQQDEPNTLPLSQVQLTSPTPTTSNVDDDFAEINQATLTPVNSKGKSNQVSSSNNSDGAYPNAEELSSNVGQDFTLFPDTQQLSSPISSTNNQQPSNDTNTPTLFSEERSFLQEHNTSSSKKKARITTASLHDRLDRLAAVSTTSDISSNHRRSDRLSTLTPIDYNENKV